MTLIWRDADPDDLQADFRMAVQSLFSATDHVFVVTRGHASLAAQAVLYNKWVAFRQGKGPPAGKAAPPGKSAHNYGLAIDVALDADPNKPGLQPTWNTKASGWVWLKSECIGHPFLDNGWWFGDWPHVQWRNWKRHPAYTGRVST